ncbi:MAG: hypothetical protein Q8N10_03295 [Phenylobacterium sp.]|uniref:hypothetical protein n=1 Tax=Phenylobacterium sp. TaxID=1871053 RepID=UPI00271F0A8A|nr:hypothetical protein [Phenylobacterium sp.]MDO8912295.1 hypothetical protein [Phenylobacterium sp.]MDP3099507.1 hypothetical protein [Phenylobacterium sp.]
MTVDVATLVFEFKSDSAMTAEQRMDGLIAKSEKLEAVAKRVRLATDRVSEGQRGAAGAAERTTQANMSLAQSEGAVERATQSAGRASAQVRAQRQLEAAAMRELAQASKAYERDLAKTAAAVDALRLSVDPLGAAVSRTNAEMAEANRLHNMGAIDAKEHAAAISVLTSRLGALDGAQAKTVGSSRAAMRAGVDLSRQFADVGVQAAMMTNPLMILVMQGPQIADTLGMMKVQGVGVGAAFAQMGAFLGPVLAILAPIALAVGAVAAGFGLLHRELSKGYPDDITKGLGLTEDQLDRVKDKTVTFGDTMMATFTVLGRHIMDTWVGGVLKWMGEQWNLTLNAMTSGAFEATTSMMAFFTASYKTIVSNWSNLPSALGVIMANTVNAMNRSLEWFINGNIKLVNKFQAAWSQITGGKAQIQLPEMKLPRYDPAKFGGADVAAGFQRDFATDRAAFQSGGRAIIGEIGAEALRRAQAQVLKDAGNAPKGASPPRDVTDERNSEIARLIAQAQQEELQARLALVTDVTERAKLEKQILQAGHLEKIAELDGRIAKIRDDKANTEAAEQIALLEGLKLTYARIEDLKAHGIDRQRDAELARQAHDIRMGEVGLQAELLGHQADLSRSTYARAQVDLDILRLHQEQERMGLEEKVQRGVLGGYTVQEVELAKQRLDVLDEIHTLQTEQASQQSLLIDAISEAADAVGNFKSAFGRGDFRGALNSLLQTIQTVRAAFDASKGGSFGGGMMTAGSAAAQMVGGKTGNAIGGGLSIAGMGMAAGSWLAGSGGVAAAGSLGTLLGGGALGAGVANGLMALAGVLGPIALAAGALYAAAKIFNVGGKPSNAGAGYNLATGEFTGKSRTEETEGAVKSAADAIMKAQQMLKASGIELGATVSGLVIGTRDLSQIYLSNGQTLTSAVGDSAAAVDAALQGILESATYQSDAQRKLVESTLAAGKGLDELANVLGAFEQAQKISGTLADEILRLTDPKAYDLKGVQDSISAQRIAYGELATAGYLTAEQFATITDQLTTLERLQIDEVLARFVGQAEQLVDTEAARAAAAAEAAEKAMAIQATQVGLMRQLQAMDDAVLGTNVVLLATRRDELAGLDEVSQGLKAIIWAREDEAKVIAANAAALEAANAKAAEMLRQRTDLEDQLLTAMGRTSEVMARQRGATLSGLDPSLRGLQSALDAVTDANARVAAAENVRAEAEATLTEVYKRERGALVAMRDEARGVSDSLRQWSRAVAYSEAGGADLSQRQTLMMAELERLVRQVQGGDLKAASEITGMGDAALAVAKDTSRTQVDYAREVARVRKLTEAAAVVADAQVGVAEAQLAALDASVSGLLTVNASVLSVRDAVMSMSAALAELARANASKSQADAAAQAALQASKVAGVTIGANDNADVAAAKALYLSSNGGIDSATFDRYVGANPFATMRRLGYDGDPEALRAKYKFATGGSFDISGPAYGDTVPVGFLGNGGEHVNISRKDSMAEMVAELRALRAEVASLRGDTAKTAENTGKTAKSSESTANTLTRVTRDGDNMVTVPLAEVA